LQSFFEKLAELLGVEADEVLADSALDSFDEWDSLGALTVVSMIDEDYGVTVLSEELARLSTVGELWQRVQAGHSAPGANDT
jgi:acyl carrier protein|tara:strand:+ start:4811 stop:5056 length:246 start_codon:yes stop_codon:yes gene_type:complete